MTGLPHPVDQVIVDDVNVSKGAFRSYEKNRAAVVLADVDEVRATDLTGQLIIQISETGSVYRAKPSDTTTIDNGQSFVRDANGLGFEIILTGIAGGISAARIFTFLGDGTTTAFDLSVPIPGLTDIPTGSLLLWWEDAVAQRQGLDYSISGTVVTRDEAPADGAFIYGWLLVSITVGADGVDGSDPGLLMNWSTLTADSDPGAGNIRADDTDLSSASFLYISKLNRHNAGISEFLAAIDDSTSAVKGHIILTHPVSGAQATFNADVLTDSTEYYKLAVSNHSGVASFTDAEAISFQFIRTGDKGDAGADGSDPGILLTWDAGTTDADPGSGEIRADNGTIGSVTTLYVSKTNRAGADISALLAALDDSTNTVKGDLLLTRTSDGEQATFKIASVTDATGYVKVGVTSPGGTIFSAADAISLQFSRAGDKGADGAAGVTSVTAGGGLSGGTITGTGTIAVRNARNQAARIGGFNVWQRGTSLAVAASTAAAYQNDGWYIVTDANQAVTISRVDGIADGSIYAAKVQRNSGQTGTGTLRFAAPLDLHEIGPLRNRAVALSFTAKAGANWSPTSGILSVAIFAGTGAAGKRNTTPYTSETTVINANATLTGAATRFVMKSPAVFPAGATQCEIHFYWTPVGTAGADDSFTIDNLQLETISTSTSDETPFTYLSYDEELRRCQFYLQQVRALLFTSAWQTVTNTAFCGPMRPTPTITSVARSGGTGGTYAILSGGLGGNIGVYQDAANSQVGTALITLSSEL